jgi:putative sigma-54 modulation protein
MEMLVIQRAHAGLFGFFEFSTRVIRLFKLIDRSYSVLHQPPAQENQMKVAMYSPCFGLTAALHEYTLRQIRNALAHTVGRVQRVSIRLRDLNGPRGGLDKRCDIHVVIDGAGQVVTTSTDSDLYAAISQAAARIGRSVSRRLRQQRKARSAKMVPELSK